MITVIIPVKNGEATLVKCLTAIKEQTIADQIEIILLDSGSNDNSIELAKTYGAKIIKIEPSKFNHGLTRNVGVDFASGELLFFTTQDAYLSQIDQLDKMAAHFEDKALQAVVGMQAIPSDLNKNPASWFKRISEPIITFSHFPNLEFSKLPNKEQFQNTSAWDNVNAMYRLSALKFLPFAETQFAEDKLWAKDALLAGYKIAFDPSLVVFHYHHRDFQYSFKVQYIVNYHYYKFFRVFPPFPTIFKPLIIAWYRILRIKRISIGKKFYWSFHSFSGLIGDFLSGIVFLIISKLFSERILEKSFKLFCGQIPQGKLKG